MSVVLAIMTFNHQLVLYHQSGDFVLCDTDGPKGTRATVIAVFFHVPVVTVRRDAAPSWLFVCDSPAQVSTSAAMAAMAVVFYYFPRSSPLSAVAAEVISVVGILAMAGNNWFYIRRLQVAVVVLVCVPSSCP